MLKNHAPLVQTSYVREVSRLISGGGKAFWSGSQWPRASRLILGVAMGMLPTFAGAQNVTFKVPPVKIPLKIKEQSVTITASALISMRSKDQETSIFKLELSADLSELQQNMTALLASQLDKDDACGERITIEHADLTPAEPASLAVVQLHYERWACAKVLGKEKSKRLVGGNAVIEVKLTPAIEENNTELRLVPEIGKIDADGSLGELLRSGTLGDMLRDKIRTSILSAMEKGTNLSATLPPAIQGHATIQNAEFKDGGSGRLVVVLDGEGRITKEQIQALTKQIKERMPAK
ncbi:MAG TPA: hypothetical protein VJW94_19695 [Candidatus Acidoferrum sp.]|nr:hypothetical protein [Candidatus Acidoferrum sp.]